MVGVMPNYQYLCKPQIFTLVFGHNGVIYDYIIQYCFQLLLQAKALDGDYCNMDEPSLLLRIEFFNTQDIPGIMQDYPVLEFERFRLYQTRYEEDYLFVLLQSKLKYLTFSFVNVVVIQ